MKRQQKTSSFISRINFSALVVGIALVAFLLVLQLRTRTSPASIELATNQQPAAEMVEGTYVGAVDLDWALVGEYTDALPTPTPQPGETPSPDMGSMDIGLILQQTGAQLSGYVDLGSTLVFTSEHTIQATPVGADAGPGTPTPVAVDLDVGPSVSGQLDGENITLASERFAMTTSAGQSLQRQFHFFGLAVDGDTHRFSGDYRETIWGLGPKPLTLVGKFTLVRPVAGEPTPTLGSQRVYLPLLQR
jgi:hypothetical protein